MKHEDCYTTEEKLLFEILQELKELNSKFETSPEIKKTETKPEIKAEIKTEYKAVPSGVPCKYCGGTHENKGQMLACARKRKKG